MEVLCQNSNHRVDPIVETHAASDDISILAIPIPPRGVVENHHRLGTRNMIRGPKEPSYRGARAEGREEVLRHLRQPHALGISVSQEHDFDAPGSHDRLGGPGIGAKRREERGAEWPRGAGIVPGIDAEEHHALGIRIRKWSQDHMVDHTEHGGHRRQVGRPFL